MQHAARRKRRHLSGFDLFNYALMAVLMVLMLYPIYYCAIVSISDGKAVVQGRVMFYPIGFSLTAYNTVLSNSQIIRSYGNTILYTTVGTAINLLMSTICAYPLSRPGLKGRSVINSIMLFTMFFSGGMIPMYLQIKRLGIDDTMWAVILPGAISTYNMIIMRTFFSSLPEELHESANIDGANSYQILLRIVLPLSMSILATMVLFYAVSHWNSYLSALLYLNDAKKFPLQMVLRNLIIDSNLANFTSSNASNSAESLVTESKLKYAAVIVSILPILCVYPILQKYFVKGVMIGAVKG
ncbi:carbohydrate ABC transporter permease [Eubacteriales bacterium OttesenSCG-928-A19]|nr:carbohydrate ABC transporter permease [Eubacteriales bacterium OttesenSCG-928-A19]